MIKPNVILINCDDLGYGDLGCYGSTVNKTPHLDRLASEGMKFTDFYMASPVCSPSRGAMLTGCYPSRIGACHHEKLVAFSCKRRGFCPSCGARRMVDSAAHLVDEVLPKRPIRQWVLSVPYTLRYLFAANPKVMSQVLTIVHRVISTFLIKRARMTVKSGAQSGAVTLIQRFGSALNLNPLRADYAHCFRS